MTVDAILKYLEKEAEQARLEYQANINQASEMPVYLKGWMNALDHIRHTIEKAAK